MLRITIEVNAPIGSVQAVKEHLAMYMERFGDTRVVSIKEEFPQQMGFSGFGADSKKETNGRN